MRNSELWLIGGILALVLLTRDKPRPFPTRPTVVPFVDVSLILDNLWA